MSRYCHFHPCLKPAIEGDCPEQTFLGVSGTEKLCAGNRPDCPFYSPLAFGQYDPEDRWWPSLESEKLSENGRDK